MYTVIIIVFFLIKPGVYAYSRDIQEIHTSTLLFSTTISNSKGPNFQEKSCNPNFQVICTSMRCVLIHTKFLKILYSSLRVPLTKEQDHN